MNSIIIFADADSVVCTRRFLSPRYVLSPLNSFSEQSRLLYKCNAWCDKPIEELQLKETEIIAMVMRGDKNIIPDGKTVIKEGDIVVLCS